MISIRTYSLWCFYMVLIVATRRGLLYILILWIFVGSVCITLILVCLQGDTSLGFLLHTLILIGPSFILILLL